MPTVCVNIYTATDLFPDSSSRLQRRQYKFSKREFLDISDYKMLSADLAGGKYVERFASLESNCALAIINDVVHARRMSFGKLELVRPRSRRSSPTLQPGVKARRRQQVAAVCFRILSTGVEFLLVRTRRGRWTFPKGGAQAGFTHAQSAALEAFEEAGVHGRIEEVAFVSYTLRRFKAVEEGRDAEAFVHAHLCEVLELGMPQEDNRNPTWFSTPKAKRRLGEGRTRENGAELARVVDRAIARIRRLPARSTLVNDPLLTVKFEASEIDVRRLNAPASTIRSLGRDGHNLVRGSADFTSKQFRGKILQLGPSPQKR
jgi:8-oxo-dGTP pyrophosphatase MutT (NUDIX family)